MTDSWDTNLLFSTILFTPSCSSNCSSIQYTELHALFLSIVCLNIPHLLSVMDKNLVVVNLPLFLCGLCSVTRLWRKKWPVWMVRKWLIIGQFFSVSGNRMWISLLNDNLGKINKRESNNRCQKCLDVLVLSSILLLGHTTMPYCNIFLV
jgi:hypothetical protein